MTARVGWYAHHHGRGHVTRARQVAAHLRVPATLLTSARLDGLDWPGPTLGLPLDVDPAAIDLPSTRALHWAPGHVPGLRARTRLLATWFDHADPSLVVVDVSVEVALLARLAGVPVAWVRQHGDRRDPAHRGAYEAASLVVSPWPAWFDDDLATRSFADRHVHVGGFSRLEGRVVARDDARRTLGWGDERHVVVVLGGGGCEVDRDALRTAVAATPHWRWTVLGLPPADDGGAPVHEPFGDVGWHPDPAVHLAAADLVVAPAGHNTVMDVAVTGTPLVVVPQPRPWDEQVHKARLLDRHGLAHVWGTWPGPDGLAARLDLAVGEPRTPRALVDGGGAARFAATVEASARALAVA